MRQERYICKNRSWASLYCIIRGVTPDKFWQPCSLPWIQPNSKSLRIVYQLYLIFICALIIRRKSSEWFGRMDCDGVSRHIDFFRIPFGTLMTDQAINVWYQACCKTFIDVYIPLAVSEDQNALRCRTRKVLRSLTLLNIYSDAAERHFFKQIEMFSPIAKE